MKKSQIELWMLSKFAILFFILALAIFLFTVSETEKSGLCSTEAGAQSTLIANSISSVLNNPVEDQQMVVKLPPAITLGSGLSAYTINVTLIEQSNAPSIINIQSQSTQIGCSSQQSVFFPNNTIVNFFNDSTSVSPTPLNGTNIQQTVLTASPSGLNTRTHFFIIIKCTNK
ncbi:MAG: hypothetical protein M1594_01565, partial [Candidatus Marsarchaeota archaeon]|nr:hypothetical protein [Candidatus Marsarchaeota archaeon]